MKEIPQSNLTCPAMGTQNEKTIAEEKGLTRYQIYHCLGSWTFSLQNGEKYISIVYKPLSECYILYQPEWTKMDTEWNCLGMKSRS